MRVLALFFLYVHSQSKHSSHHRNLTPRNSLKSTRSAMVSSDDASGSSSPFVAASSFTPFGSDAEDPFEGTSVTGSDMMIDQVDNDKGIAPTNPGRYVIRGSD